MSLAFVSLLLLAWAACATAHLSFVTIMGSNNLVGHGFGVETNGKYPRTGTTGDAGGDSTVFQTGTDNPSPACGRTPELGELDIPAWLSQAEGFGLPTAYPNMSIVADTFQVNRDGGGPMSCEYSQDASATSWQPMSLSLNQAGNDGILDVQRQNSTVVINFPDDAKCTGGWTQAACIVRCRTGVNKRFGGCFAVKLSDSSAQSATRDFSSTTSNNATYLTPSATSGITPAQLSTLAQQIIMDMKSNGLLIDLRAAANYTSSLSIDNSVSTSLNTLPSANVTTPTKVRSGKKRSPAPCPRRHKNHHPKTG